MVLSNVQDAFIHELGDVLSAEKQLTHALPKMAKTAHREELRQAFEEHLEQTRHHVELVEKAFAACGRKPSAHKCEAMEGILREGEGIIAEDAEDDVKDAMLIAGAQKVEHYEIASYGTLCTWAEMMGNDEALQPLQEILAEEKQTDEKLTNLAKQRVNRAALESE